MSNQVVLKTSPSSIQDAVLEVVASEDLPSTYTKAFFFDGVDDAIEVYDRESFICHSFKDIPFVCYASSDDVASMSFMRLEAASVLSIFELNADACKRITNREMDILSAFRKVVVEGPLTSVYSVPSIQDAMPVLSTNGFIGLYQPGNPLEKNKRYIIVRNDAGNHILDHVYEKYIQSEATPLSELHSIYTSLREYTIACTQMIMFGIAERLGIVDCVELEHYSTRLPFQLRPGWIGERVGVKAVFHQAYNMVAPMDTDSVITNLSTLLAASKLQTYHSHSQRRVAYYVSNPIYGMYLLNWPLNLSDQHGAFPIMYRPSSKNVEQHCILRDLPSDLHAAIEFVHPPAPDAFKHAYVYMSSAFTTDFTKSFYNDPRMSLTDFHLCPLVFFAVQNEVQ